MNERVHIELYDELKRQGVKMLYPTCRGRYACVELKDGTHATWKMRDHLPGAGVYRIKSSMGELESYPGLPTRINKDRWYNPKFELSFCKEELPEVVSWLINNYRDAPPKPIWIDAGGWDRCFDLEGEFPHYFWSKKGWEASEAYFAAKEAARESHKERPTLH